MSVSHYWIMLAPLAALLSGCDLGPDYKRPQTPAPNAWNVVSPQPTAAWPSDDWWKAFGSPELDGLMANAWANNTDLAAAAARVREADAEARIAGAPLLPSLGAQIEAGPDRQLSQSGHERHHTTYQGLLQASYEIDFWGKNAAALQSAEATAGAARYQREVVWLTISTSVANTYFEILGLQDRLRIAHENLAAAQSYLGMVIQAQKQGIVPQLNIVQQQSVVASLMTLLPPLQHQLVLQRNSLAVLIGELPDSLQLAGGSLDDLLQPEVMAGLPSGLLARRPDVQAAEAQLIAANANIKVARADFFPSFDLTADGGVTSFALSHATVGPLGVYTLLASITQPIFHGGALRGQFDETKAQYQVVLAGTYQKAVLSAFSDVEGALDGVQATSEEQIAQQNSLVLARESNTLATGALHGGTNTIFAVLLSETSLYSSEDALAQARLAHLQALIELFGALGGGWKS